MIRGHLLCCYWIHYNLCSCCRFDRVLALPSDNWLDGSESWWCHGGGHCHSTTETCSSASHDVELSLSMKPQDCLVGDSCIVVSDEALIDGSCLSQDCNLIRCHRCQNIVGRDLNAGNHPSDASFISSGDCLVGLMTTYRPFVKRTILVDSMRSESVYNELFSRMLACHHRLSCNLDVLWMAHKWKKISCN